MKNDGPRLPVAIRSGVPLAGIARTAAVLRPFELSEMGIDAAAFLARMRPAFADTAWDGYDVLNARLDGLARAGVAAGRIAELRAEQDERIRDARLDALIRSRPPHEQQAFGRMLPYRRRAIRKYALRHVGDRDWRVAASDDVAFRQSGNAYRGGYTRHFRPAAPAVTCDADLQTAIASIAETIRGIRPGTERMQVVLHQVATIARAALAGHPAPEGLHQDGADFIVSALVVARAGVAGGVSRVRDGRDGPLLLESVLEPGQGIFQADAGSPLWHEVSPVHALHGTGEGARLIFGFDIHLD